MVKYYIVGGMDGWLNVKRDPGGQIIALPEYLQIELTQTQSGRDYFKTLEGPEGGKKFSVKRGNLKTPLPTYKPGAQLVFYISQEKLTYPGGTIKAITAKGAWAIPAGVHPIQLPDFPHDLGTAYLGQSHFAESWFYLGKGVAIPGNDDRYLHTGRVSAGCVTVEPSVYTEFYRYLILCRKGDGKNVGSITVYP